MENYDYEEVNELLNPWQIEVTNKSKWEITLSIVNQDTGVIRQVTLDVNDINELAQKEDR